MPVRLFLLSLVSFAIAGCSSADFSNGASSKGFSVTDGKLVDATRTPFIMRGINHPHAWQRARTQTVLPQIADTDANMVRVSLSTGAPWQRTSIADVERIIRLARANDMILMLTVHNTTGYGDQDWAIPLSETIPYWLSLKEVLEGEEKYVLINPGNEPTGNSIADATYKQMWVSTIRALRDGGLKHTLVVDGHNWGQDASGMMARSAPEIFAADPLANTIFSVHMYQVYDEPDKIEQYFEAFDAMQLPLIVGEFGPDHQGHPVDEETIFQLSDQMAVGYIGWSWSGNSAEVDNLDITIDFDPDRLSPWGEQLINGPGGIRETSIRSGVFTEPTVLIATGRRFHKLRMPG